VLGNKDVTETAWCGRLQDLEDGKQGTPPKEALRASDYKGLFRKNTCSGSGMGLKVDTTALTIIKEHRRSVICVAGDCSFHHTLLVYPPLIQSTG
jgi:hypothetical protein